MSIGRFVLIYNFKTTAGGRTGWANIVFFVPAFDNLTNPSPAHKPEIEEVLKYHNMFSQSGILVKRDD